MPEEKERRSEQPEQGSDKENRRFRTLDELQEEYDAQEHHFKDEMKDIWKNFKDELFSMWGLLILSMLTVGILSAVVR